MIQLPLFLGTGTWVMVGVAGTESVSTSPYWIPLPTVTDAPAHRVLVPPPAPLPEGGLVPLPAAIPYWWRRMTWTMPQWTLCTPHPPGPHPLGAKSVETHLLTPPTLQGEAVTQRNCKDATLKVETPSTWLRHSPAIVSSASPRKPGRHHWDR